MNDNANQSAFPKVKTEMAQSSLDYNKVYGNTFSIDGLTKREYFAAMAMQGILANSEFLMNFQDVDIHVLAVKQADHLLKQLES